MFDYAKISKMDEYMKTGKWPLKKPAAAAPVPEKKSFKGKIKCRVKEYLGIPNELPYYYNTNIFRAGTRGWEYPWILEQLTRVKHGATVLDCGCGSSDFILQYHAIGLNPIGLDYVRSKEHPNSELTKEHVDALKGTIEFINGGMQEIPLDSSSVDIVTCISVMEHIVIEHKDDPQYHYKCLSEMKRVLKPGGLLICTYDTILNREAVYGGTKEWGENGWNYSDDIRHLTMEFSDPGARIKSAGEIYNDEDTFFVPPDLYLERGYGSGFNLFGPYHRLTSVGFVLVKMD